MIANLPSFLSTLSLRRATPPGLLHSLGGVISIHALLAESDRVKVYNKEFRAISIHALLAESDGSMNINPPCFVISIHALLAESDAERLCDALEHLHFYPRSPCGERPGQFRRCTRSTDISIHALLAESDFAPFMRWVYARLFLSTLSLRRATPPAATKINPGLFLSTLSLRRATLCHLYKLITRDEISIHALLAESDDSHKYITFTDLISIHALLAESDHRCFNASQNRSGFLSTLSLRRATDYG